MALALVLAGVLALGVACERGDDAGVRAAALPPFDDAQAEALLQDLVSGDAEREGAALDAIEARGDVRFVAPLVELLWASEFELVPRAGHHRRVVVLEHLSGQRFGASWFAWTEWLGARQPPLPPGFAVLKARLLAEIAPGYGELLAPGRVDPGTLLEVHWSGAEDIPSLDEPPRVAADEAGYLSPQEPVVGVSRGGEARAYPLRILDWHEVANDVLGGEPLAVVSCPLCGSQAVFETGLPDGSRRRLRATGLVWRSASLLVDEASGVLFSPVARRALAGDGERASLELAPFVLTTWGSWREEHPETTVLALETGFTRPYVPGQPYGEYFASPRLRFPVAERDERLGAKQHVYGLLLGDGLAFSLDRLHEEGVVNDAGPGGGVVIVARRGRIRATWGDPSLGLDYLVGAEVRAYRSLGHTFERGAALETLSDERGRLWRAGEAELVGPDGERAPRLPGILAYWFAWQAFHPDTELR